MRYEIKYVLDPNSLNRFSVWLAGAAYFRRAFPCREVNSVYFDTSEMAAAMDNLAGISIRNKFRLRWYSGLDSSQSPNIDQPKFEIKSKQGRLGQKFDRTISAIDVESIYKNDAEHLASQVRKELVYNDWPDLNMHPDFLDPKLLVKYKRSYYVGPEDIRVTVDRNISFGDILSNTHHKIIGQQSYSKAIIEFKFPPKSQHQAAEIMSSLPFYPVRSSKYLTGLSLFNHAVYI